MAIISGSSASKRTRLEQPRPGPEPEPEQAKKRNNCPGIRVKGARIYDSKDGKTCHQCRQKTRDFSAACMNQREGKQCTVRFCHKCLLNRYGEQAEVVAHSGEWNCPRCRGICNCSVCMKRKGLSPTGQLISTARASGFSSVSEMLHVSINDSLGSTKAVQNTGSLPSETVETEEDISTNLSRKQDKENIFDGKIDPNLQAKPSSPIGAQKKSKKLAVEDVNQRQGQTRVGVVQAKTTRQSGKKAEVLKEAFCVNLTTAEHEKEKLDLKPQNNADLDNCKAGVKKQNNKKRKESTEIHVNEMEIKTCLLAEEKKLKKPKQEGFQNKEEPGAVVETKPTESKSSDIVLGKDLKENIFRAKAEKIKGKKLLPKDCSIPLGAGIENISKPHIPLPQGTGLMNVSGIEIPSEDVGNALQFLEFCSVFGKAIDVKKGQPESVVRDILQGRVGRRGKYSMTVQFLIHLLSFIHGEEGSSSLSPTYGKKSWIHSLKQCISDSHDVAKLMDLDILDEGADIYESLSSSKKLKLLNFLCDEILGTSKIRNWIEEQTAKLAEKAKEVRRKVIAAKDKEKSLKQKMQDDIASAVLANNGASLSVAEYEAIIAEIKQKTAEAQAEVLESKGLLKGSQISDSVRIEPILLDTCDGHAYYKLKGRSDKSDILLQDLGSGDTLALKEKWFAFDDEQKDAIEKHICLHGKKRLRAD